MDAEMMLEAFAEQQGWDAASQISVLLRYIENQGANDAFDDFLAQQAAEENGDENDDAFRQDTDGGWWFHPDDNIALGPYESREEAEEDNA